MHPFQWSFILSSSLIVPVAAVDIGYFATKYTLGRNTTGKSVVLCDSFPSIAPRVQKTLSRTLGADPLEGVSIGIDGVDYFVGPDASMRSTGRDARIVLEQYSTSSEYRALFLGTLYYIAKHALEGRRNVNTLEIQTLVSGLPLNTIDQYSQNVRTMMKGAFELPALPGHDEPLKVIVKRCEVVAQPQGALVCHAAESQNPETMKNNNLVLDMGGGTFDWFLCYGAKPVHDRSGAYPKGMLSCAFHVCDQIREGLRNDPIIVSRVDEAVRQDSRTVKISGKDLPIEQYRAGVEAILQECLNRMLETVANLDSVDQILVTGGGGERLYKAMLELMPSRVDMIHVDPDPVFSNVRGFYYLGELINRGHA